MLGLMRKTTVLIGLSFSAHRSTTSSLGRYVFDVQSGVRTDDYRVRVVKNSSGTAVTPGSQLSASITRGDQFERGLDLPVSVTQPASSNTAVTAVAQATAMSSAVPLATSAGVDQIMEEFGTIRRRRV